MCRSIVSREKPISIIKIKSFKPLKNDVKINDTENKKKLTLNQNY